VKPTALALWVSLSKVGRGIALEADAAELEAGIRNGDEPNLLIAGADIWDVEAKHFQALFELFQGEIVGVQHDRYPF
jgi:hypothetical protein